MKRHYFKDQYNGFKYNVKSISFIYPDLCACGHEKYYYSNLDECNSSGCGCKRFLP